MIIQVIWFPCLSVYLPMITIAPPPPHFPLYNGHAELFSRGGGRVLLVVKNDSLSVRSIGIQPRASTKIEKYNSEIRLWYFVQFHQENMSVQYIPPYTPLLYSKTGVCSGIRIFLIFAPKHRLWVLGRTASARRF